MTGTRVAGLDAVERERFGSASSGFATQRPSSPLCRAGVLKPNAWSRTLKKPLMNWRIPSARSAPGG